MNQWHSMYSNMQAQREAVAKQLEEANGREMKLLLRIQELERELLAANAECGKAMNEERGQRERAEKAEAEVKSLQRLLETAERKLREAEAERDVRIAAAEAEALFADEANQAAAAEAECKELKDVLRSVEWKGRCSGGFNQGLAECPVCGWQLKYGQGHANNCRLAACLREQTKEEPVAVSECPICVHNCGERRATGGGGEKTNEPEAVMTSEFRVSTDTGLMWIAAASQEEAEKIARNDWHRVIAEREQMVESSRWSDTGREKASELPAAEPEAAKATPSPLPEHLRRRIFKALHMPVLADAQTEIAAIYDTVAAEAAARELLTKSEINSPPDAPPR